MLSSQACDRKATLQTDQCFNFSFLSENKIERRPAASEVLYCTAAAEGKNTADVCVSIEPGPPKASSTLHTKESFLSTRALPR